MFSRILPAIAAFTAIVAIAAAPAIGSSAAAPSSGLVFKCPPVVGGAADSGLSLEAPAEVAEYRLVSFRVRNVPASAAVLWEVSPSEAADVEESGERLIMTAPPGTYRVVALVVDAVGGKTVAKRLRATVTVRGKTPPAAPPKGDKPKTAATKDALGRISFTGPRGTNGCTATVMHPRLADGRYHVLTASHCLPADTGSGRMRCSNGKVYDVTIAAVDRKPDVAWLIMSDPGEDLPAARLADAVPEAGSRVWHAGFGFDRPGNREDGEVGNFYTASGRQGYILNVSSGDSGGAIFDDATGHVLGPVCCTDAVASKAKMLAGNPSHCARLRPPIE